MSDTMDPIAGESGYPLQRTLGFAITGWAPDYARVELPLGEHLANRHGIPHGGVYATLLDTALGYCGCYTGSTENKRMAMTLSLTVNFLSRPKGDLLICEARRTGGGARTFFAEGTIKDETGETVATATGVFRYRSASG